MAVPLAGFGCKGNEGARPMRSLYISLCVTAICLAASPVQAAPLTGRSYALDGDTLVIREQHVRLFGVDAFEHDQTCGAYRCGQKATAALNELLRGRIVTCEKQDMDQYGRVVAVCRLADGRDLGREMVRRGLAVAYRSFSTRYIADESAARSAKAGAWAYGFDSPLKYRRAHPRY